MLCCARNAVRIACFFVCAMLLVLTNVHTHTLTHTHAILIQHRSTTSTNSTNSSLSAWLFFNTPKYELGNATFNNVTGTLTLSLPDVNGCTMDERMRGLIVMVNSGTCSSATKMIACQRVGCLAVIEHNDVNPYAGALMWSYIDASIPFSQLHAPCVEINPDNGGFIKQLMSTPNSEVIAILSSQDPTLWVYFASPTWLLVRLFLLVLCGVPLLTASYRLLVWWKSPEKLGRSAFVVLALEGLANLERFTYIGEALVGVFIFKY